MLESNLMLESKKRLPFAVNGFVQNGGKMTGRHAIVALFVLAVPFLRAAESAVPDFVHGDADGWAAMNSVKAWEQLRRMGIQGELHTLAKRPHCFQRKAAPGTGSYTHLDRIWEFLSTTGKLQ